MVPDTADTNSIILNSYLICILTFCWIYAPLVFNPWHFDFACVKDEAIDFFSFMTNGKWTKEMYDFEQTTYTSAFPGQCFGWVVTRQLPRFLVIVGAAVGTHTSIAECDKDANSRIIILTIFTLMVSARALRSFDFILP